MFTSLVDLAKRGDVADLRKRLAGKSPKLDACDGHNMTALHWGAQKGHVEVCRELLSAGASADLRDKQGRTALFLATEENKATVVVMLCEAGANTALTGPDERTPLHVAAINGYIECATTLLQHGAKSEGHPDKWGKTPEDDCSVSSIRLAIQNARRERPQATGQPASPSAPSFPSHSSPGDALPMGGATPVAPPPYLGGGPTASNPGEAAGGPGYMYPRVVPRGEGGGYDPDAVLRPPPVAPGSDSAGHHPSGHKNDEYSYEYKYSGAAAGWGGGGEPARRDSCPEAKGGGRGGAGRDSKGSQGGLCVACSGREGERQLAPCKHVVCLVCAREAKAADNLCPLCGVDIYDDNPLLAQYGLSSS